MKGDKRKILDNLFTDESQDLEDSISDGLMILKRHKTKSKAELNRIRKERVFGFIKNLKEGLNNDIEKYREFSNAILSKPQYSELQAMFSNLSDMTEEDEKSILLDSKYLELLDELEDDFENLD